MNPASQSTAMTARARRYLADAGHAFEHAPVEVSLSVLLAVAFSYMVSGDGDTFRAWVELAIVTVLAGAAAFTATLLHALGAWSVRTRWLVTVIGTAAAALYGLFLLDLDRAAEAWRAAALVAAAALFLLAAPAFAGAAAGATERFRRISGRLLLRSLAVLLYAGALFAGLALALGAVDSLFELQLDETTYAHVAGWIFLVLVTWVVVGGMPDYARQAESASPVASTVHRMSAYLVTPLVAVYYAILYAYAIRIAFTGELPKNLVSPLVIAAGVLAGVALVLFDRDDDRVSFSSLRAAAPLFVPLCVLGVWALTMRLGQYGWTEFRGLRTVLLVLLGALATGATIRVMRRRSLRLHLLPLTLAAGLVLSVIGPWSVIAGSRRSQQARLSAAMTSAGLDGNALTVGDSVIGNEEYREIQSTVRYLNAHYGADALPPLFARHAQGAGFIDVVRESGLRPTSPDMDAPRRMHAQLADGAVLVDDADGTLHYVRLDRPGIRDVSGTDTTEASFAVRITVAGVGLIADLKPVASSLLDTPGQQYIRPEFARVPVCDAAGTERGELLVLEIGIGGDQASRVYRLVGLVRLSTE